MAGHEPTGSKYIYQLFRQPRFMNGQIRHHNSLHFSSVYTCKICGELNRYIHDHNSLTK